MGFLSKIKIFGTSVVSNLQLCDKSWKLLEGKDNLTLIFKSDKKLHFIIGGTAKIIPWEYFLQSGTLIFYFSNAGKSYHLKFVNDDTLILTDEETGEDECFANLNGKDSPKTIKEAYKNCFHKRVKYLINERQKSIDCHSYGVSDYYLLTFTDKATEGLSGKDMIHCIDAFRVGVPDFNMKYVFYLGYYQRRNDPNFDEKRVDEKLRRKWGWGLWQPLDSKSLNEYIRVTKDSIYTYHLVSQ